jgi:hypothetical protein
VSSESAARSGSLNFHRPIAESTHQPIIALGVATLSPSFNLTKTPSTGLIGIR